MYHVDASGYEAELWRLGFDARMFRRGAMQERLRGVCLELGLQVHDATPWLAADGAPASLFLADRGHLSPLGHMLVARHLEPVVRDLWR